MEQKQNDEFVQADYRKDGDRIEVYVCFVVNQVAEVDVVRQTFNASFDLELLWRATEDDERRFKEDPIHYSPSYIPNVDFPNGTLAHKRLTPFTDGRTFAVCQPGQPNIRGRVFKSHQMKCKYLNQCIYSIDGKFHEQFELPNFPMDAQDMQITLKMAQTSDVAIFAPKPLMNSFAVVLDKQCWSVSDYDVLDPILELWMEDIGNNASLSHCTLRLKFVRKWIIYFWRVGIFSMILSLCSFVVFTLDNHEVADRYATLFTVMLAAVAFEYIIYAELPKLPYLTLMDMYQLFCFAFVFLVIVLVSISGFLEFDQHVDQLCACSAAMVFVFFHIFIGIKGYRARLFELRKVTMDRWDYEQEENDKNQTQISHEVILMDPDEVIMDRAHKNELLKSTWWTRDEKWADNSKN